MKKAWKWILGILIVLVVVIALVAVPFVMHSYMSTGTQTQMPAWNNGPSEGWQHPVVPGMPGGFDGRRSSRSGFSPFNRFSPFGFGFIFLAGLLRLIPLALFGLLLWGVYQLGKRAGLRAAAPAPAQPAESVTPQSQA